MNQSLSEFFAMQPGIASNQVKFYVIWVNRFLKTYSGKLDSFSDLDLQRYKDNLEKAGLPEWQVFQALHAVKLYIESYKNRTILSCPDVSTEKRGPATEIHTWQHAKDRFVENMRLKHYAYNTEKTYREWIRRFILHTKLKAPADAKPEHVRAFLTHLAVNCKVTSSTQNQAFHALLFLYRRWRNDFTLYPFSSCQNTPQKYGEKRN